MKRLILSSLLSCMLIGQVSCDADQIVTKNGVAACTTAIAGFAGFITPALVAHYTNAAAWIKNYTEKHNIAEAIGIKRTGDAMMAAWWWSAATIVAASATIATTVNNEMITEAATMSIFGALLSIACSCAI